MISWGVFGLLLESSCLSAPESRAASRALRPRVFWAASAISPALLEPEETPLLTELEADEEASLAALEAGEEAEEARCEADEASVAARGSVGAIEEAEEAASEAEAAIALALDAAADAASLA